MTRKTVIILIILLFTFSCVKDVPFEIPEAKTELALFAENYPEDSLEVIISLAQTMGHYPYYNINEPVKISLFEDNNLLQEKYAKMYGHKYIDTAFYGITNFDNEMLKEGNRYQIKVSNPGYDDIEAETIKPVSVKIKSLTWKHIEGKMPEWYFDVYGSYEAQNPMGPTTEYTHMIEFSITFDDPPVNNFYQCGIHIFYDIYEAKIGYASFGWPDPPYNIVSYITPPPDYSTRAGHANEIVFDDKDFNGEEKTIKLVVPVKEIIAFPYDYIIKLYSLSEDHYKYIVSEWLYNRSKDDPFAEPVDFYSNVNNETGIFAIASCDFDTIIVNEK
ncbi:MAG: DUF4249 family protein [Bacteroidales bacterium]|nr:DUF4249 family protein [Bacteroidales bacterium]